MPPSDDGIESRLEFETLLADLSSRFIGLAPGDVDREIEDGLRSVCGLLGIDVAVLWQWPAGSPDVIEPTHAYPPRDGPGAFEPLRRESYPWAVAEMRAGRRVVLASLEERPPDAAADRESGRLGGIRSNLTLPLSVGGGPPAGALAFHTRHAGRDWPDALVKRLQLVAQVFANALSRRRFDQALRESEELNRATFEQAAVGIAHVGLDGRWLRVNDRICAIVGYGREELLQRTFQDITHPADLEADLDLVRQVLAGAIRTYSMAKRYVRRDGSLVWANLTVSLARNEAGEPRHFISVLEDITERKRAEEALQTNEGRLAAAAALAGLGFYEIDHAAKVMFVDDRLRDLCGVPPERAGGLEAMTFWQEHLHPDDVPGVLELQARLHGGLAGRVSTVYRYQHPARGLRWIHQLADVRARDSSGRAARTYGVMRDVTDEKQAEAALKGLSRRLLEAHEAERALLARELHDDLSQRLALLAIEAGRAERAPAGGRTEEPLRSIREGLVRLSEDVHALAYQLHPSVLEELGLAEALRTECERRRRQGGLQIAVSADERADLGPESALCLFRVAQEALNNATRHAEARTVTVDLRPMESGMLLAVRDDGVGFDPAAPRSGRSLGLASMRERVQLVNGSLDVESAPGEGTAVLAWVPGRLEPG